MQPKPMNRTEGYRTFGFDVIFDLHERRRCNLVWGLECSARQAGQWHSKKKGCTDRRRWRTRRKTPFTQPLVLRVHEISHNERPSFASSSPTLLHLGGSKATVQIFEVSTYIMYCLALTSGGDEPFFAQVSSLISTDARTVLPARSSPRQERYSPNMVPDIVVIPTIELGPAFHVPRQ